MLEPHVFGGDKALTKLKSIAEPNHTLKGYTQMSEIGGKFLYFDYKRHLIDKHLNTHVLLVSKMFHLN